MTTVTVVLVARNGAKHLPATLDALAQQTRRPDRILAIDAASSDASLKVLQERLPGVTVVSARRGSLAQVAQSVLNRVPTADETEWYWFLGHDNAPHPRALEALLAAVEVSPSVLVAGPKLMRWDDKTVIHAYGEALTSSGESLQLVVDELDQSQHDLATDVLGVAVPGSLVQAALWHRLGGFDDGLPAIDAGLDFGVRARLTGARVERVPGARVASAGPVEVFGRRRLGAGTRNRLRRSAQIHRRLVYSPGWALPLLWLAVLPVAIGRSLWRLLAKQPSLVPGELGAGLLGIVDGTVLGARGDIAKTRRVGWAAIAPFRVTGRDATELKDRAVAVEARTADLPEPMRERAPFFASGGAWAVLIAAVASIVVFGRWIGAPAVAGGALAPLGPIASLWETLGIRARLEDGGFVGTADPFHAVLALLGSATWWSPSLAIVILLIAAMPLAALGAWFAAARLSPTGWGPAVAALGWAIAPPLIAAASDGRVGAILAHVLLPWLVAAVIDARTSWSRAAVAALLFAGVVAGAPVLAPALVLLLVTLMIVQPTRIHRLAIIVLPAAVLAAPLVLAQLGRGTPFAALADPGIPVAAETPRMLALLLGSPSAHYLEWQTFVPALAAAFGLPDLGALTGTIVLAIVVAPIGLLAVLACFLRGGTRAIPALVVAAAGLATAVGATVLGVAVTPLGEIATIWPGSGVSLYWLGLLGAAVVALDGLGRWANAPAIVAVLGLVLAVVPLGLAGATGQTAVQPSAGRVLPALVAAEGVTDPGLGTLDITAQGAAEYAVVLQRGAGLTMERITTLETTRTSIEESDRSLVDLVANLVSDSGLDLGAALDEAQVEYVLLRGAGAGTAAYARAVDALAANPDLVSVGLTPLGPLWQHPGATSAAPATEPGPWDTPLGAISAAAQLGVVGVFLLLAVPTVRRRGVRAVRGRDADLTARDAGGAGDADAAAELEEVR